MQKSMPINYVCVFKVIYAPKLVKKTLNALLPFLVIYLCKAGFSGICNLKNKYGDRLHVAPDLRLAPSKRNPCIDSLIAKKIKQK